MPRTPEDEAREQIDRMLDAAGWAVQDAAKASIHSSRGVALRNFTLASGHGFADYLPYVDGAAAGVVEADSTSAPDRTAPYCCRGRAAAFDGGRDGGPG